MVVTATLALVIVIWCVYRMRRYPLAKGLRRLAPVYVPSVLASRPIIRLANRMLLAMPRPEATRLVDEEEGVIDLGDHILNYVIYRPKNASGPLPAMLYMHGGGFFLEAAPYLYGKAMGYSSGAGCIVMVPRYRTSDAHSWPAGEDDCMAALRHLCSLDGVDATRIALGGDSAGACIAATLARRCRKEGIGVCFQLLVYPVLDDGLTSDSSLRYRACPVWNTALSRRMWDMYLDGRRGEYVSPLAENGFSTLPPAYIEAARYDSLHDDALSYADRLREAGVEVEFHDVEGACHGYDAMVSCDVARRMLSVRIRALSRAFGISQEE